MPGSTPPKNDIVLLCRHTATLLNDRIRRNYIPVTTIMFSNCYSCLQFILGFLYYIHSGPSVCLGTLTRLDDNNDDDNGGGRVVW